MNDIKITNLFGSKTKEFVLNAISLYEDTLDNRFKPTPYGKRAFSAICGISARRHIRTVWRESCPDRFYFYKNGRSYWTDIDSLRHDGENANCVYTGRN